MREIVERLKENRQIELAKSILESNGYTVRKRVSEESEIKRPRKSVFSSMYQEYAEKGKSILDSGKTFEQIIQDASSYLRELQDQVDGVNKERKSVARDMKKSGSDDHDIAASNVGHYQNRDQIEREMTDYYEETVVPVLAAKDLLKINRSSTYGHIIMKSIDPKYSLNSLSGGKQKWWKYK